MTAALKTLASPGPEDTPPMQPEGSPTQQAGQLKEFSVTAKKFAFEPSTITVRKGDMVKLAITSVDVTHGFSLSGFNVNANIEPGRETVVEFTVDKEGSFTFFCSVFCGEGHGGMKGQLVVEP